MPQDLEEKEISSQQMYQGNFISVYKDEVALPDGNLSTREYVKHPGAVAVLALLENGNLVLVKQYRYPVKQTLVELPAGKIDLKANGEPEDILLCAQRELLEETGYVAEEWTHLATAWPCIGYATERMEYFLARNLTFKKQQLDEGEFLEVFELAFDEAIRWIQQGRISDSKTIVGLFWLEKTLRGWS